MREFTFKILKLISLKCNSDIWWGKIKCPLLRLLQELNPLCINFCYFRKLYPEMPNHKLGTVIDHLLDGVYDAHNAIADVGMLQQCCCKDKSNIMYQYSFPLSDVEQQLRQDATASECMPSLDILVEEKVLGKAMAGKAAKSGLNLHHLKLAFRRQGKEDIMNLLSERDSSGCLRVTQSKNIIDKLCTYLSK